MRGYILNPLSVDIDFAIIAQAFQILGPREWTLVIGTNGCVIHGILPQGLAARTYSLIC